VFNKLTYLLTYLHHKYLAKSKVTLLRSKKIEKKTQLVKPIYLVADSIPYCYAYVRRVNLRKHWYRPPGVLQRGHYRYKRADSSCGQVRDLITF